MTLQLSKNIFDEKPFDCDTSCFVSFRVIQVANNVQQVNNERIIVQSPTKSLAWLKFQKYVLHLYVETIGCIQFLALDCGDMCCYYYQFNNMYIQIRRNAR